nr:six-cysteine peptide SCIFF [Bacilli bacterium]
MKHIQVIAKNHLDIACSSACVSCSVSCQSACKTSATVGSSLCQERQSGESKVRRPMITR